MKFIDSITVGMKEKNNRLRASLGSVVVIGGPPVDNRTCNLVSFVSLLEVEAAAAAGVGGVTSVASKAWPSRSAFSLAAFSARAFLSASI